MERSSIVGAGWIALSLACAAWAGEGPALKPVTSVELTDPAGDVYAANGPGNDRDVVKVLFGSDGSSITLSATTNEDEHGTMASAVLHLFLDTDNNGQTGGVAPDWEAKPPKRGYEFDATLSMCMAWDKDIGACSGGPADAPKATPHPRILLEKFTGAAGAKFDFDSREQVIHGYGPAGPPFKGRIVQGKIPYDSLGVKSGQVVRITARESTVYGDTGYFPDVLLALK